MLSEPARLVADSVMKARADGICWDKLMKAFRLTRQELENMVALRQQELDDNLKGDQSHVRSS